MKISGIKKLILMLTACAILMLASAAIFSANSVVYAAPTEQTESAQASEGDEGEIQPRWTDLSLSINCGDGKVWATVKNDFTLFYSTVNVIVMLYSSDFYTESYSEMTLTSYNEIADLDMGKTITTEASTGGVERYWIARMRYKINSGDWKEKTTGTCRISGTGEYLGHI